MNRERKNVGGNCEEILGSIRDPLKGGEEKNSPKKIDSSMFVITTLNRLLESQSLKEERIKDLQKKKYKEQLLSLKDKPTINARSKEIVNAN